MSESSLSLDDRCMSAVAQSTGATAVPARFPVAVLTAALSVSTCELTSQARE